MLLQRRIEDADFILGSSLSEAGRLNVGRY